MKPLLIEALQDEIRSDSEGAIVTNAIAIVEFYDPVENHRVVVTMGAGADGTPLTPWLASGLLEVACHSELRVSQPFTDSDEDEPEDDAES